MSFPQSKLERWAKEMGATHAEWLVPVLAEAYHAGYTEAYPHAAKHTVEKVLDILEKNEFVGAKSDDCRLFTLEEIKLLLKDKKNW